jgi:SNF2 family DNA or RNA helicase
MVELREYQDRIAHEGFRKLMDFDMLYLAMEVRTGKTLTALEICKRFQNLFGANRKRVLFVTKKKAMESILSDAELLEINYDLVVINYESLHKVEGIFDIAICDEAQRLGSAPKPCKAAKELKKIITPDTRVIYLSGTPTPETYAQIYHQLWIHPRSPFAAYKTFYAWANAGYINIKRKYVAHGNAVNDYTDANRGLIEDRIEHIFISFTQDEAGFDLSVSEEVLYVDMKSSTKALIKKLMDDEVVVGSEHTILADTGAKMQQKCHQLWSGTIKFECGERMVIDTTKAEFIHDYFNGIKIAIFYKFIAEGDMLKKFFPEWTDSPEEFNASDDLTFICQVQSGREGVNLSSADALVFFSIDFSATSYFQARDRMTSKTREKENKVYWIFERGGISEKIYKVVQKKTPYTLNHFKRDFL